MSEIDDIVGELREGLLGVIRQEAGELAKGVEDDAHDFLRCSEANVRKWTAALLEKKLSTSEFESLVRGQKDLAAMKCCTTAGVAAAKVDRMKNGFVEVVVKTAIRRIA